MNKEIVKFSLATLLALMLVPQVQAASVTVTLDQSNVDVLPDGLDYLSVTVSDGAAGAIDFSVDIQPLLTDLNAGADFGVEFFALNTGGGSATADNFLLPDGWVARHEGTQGLGDFGLFDVLLKGSEQVRKQPLEFSIVGIDGDTVFDYVSSLSTGHPSQGHVVFGALLGGFELDYAAAAGQDILSFDELIEGEGEIPGSAKFGGPTSVVPLPPAMALMLSASAVLGMAGIRRRKQAVH